MQKLSIDEFLEIYRTVGEVGAKLVASNVGTVEFDDLMAYAPTCVKYFKDRLKGHHWLALLSQYPEDAIHCNWERITNSQMVDLLVIHPQFAEHARWQDFLVHNWIDLLNRQPQLAKYFHTLSISKRERYCDMSNDIVRLTCGVVV